MTKEQEEAISTMQHWIDYEKRNKDKIQKADELINIQETVLSMLQEKDKEIEKYKYLYQKTLDNTIQVDRENIKLKKQIDLMADFIFQSIDVEEDICNSAYIKCKQETGQDITCINCIKQYFKNKVKE